MLCVLNYSAPDTRAPSEAGIIHTERSSISDRGTKTAAHGPRHGTFSGGKTRWFILDVLHLFIGVTSVPGGNCGMHVHSLLSQGVFETKLSGSQSVGDQNTKTLE